VRRTSLIGLIEVDGVLRLDTVLRLWEAVLEVLTAGPETIVLDLTGVEAIEDEPSLVMFATLGRLVADRAQSELLLAVPSLRLRVALQRAAPLFVRVFATRAEACLAAEQRASRRRVSERLSPTLDVPRFVRRIVDEVCTRWNLGDELRERAQIVVTELVTNTIGRVSDGIRLMVTIRLYVLRIEVGDDSDVLLYLSDTPGGHGLRLVAKLASRLSCRSTSRGRIIWADLVIKSHARQRPGTRSPPAIPLEQ
jgi:anti-sigma regulatory factor (Ser/Thr protein kinase)